MSVPYSSHIFFIYTAKWQTYSGFPTDLDLWCSSSFPFRSSAIATLLRIAKSNETTMDIACHLDRNLQQCCSKPRETTHGHCMPFGREPPTVLLQPSPLSQHMSTACHSVRNPQQSCSNTRCSGFVSSYPAQGCPFFFLLLFVLKLLLSAKCS